MPKYKPETINAEDYANVTGIAKQTVYNWIYRDQMDKFVVKPRKINAKWVFLTQEVEKALGVELRPIDQG